MAKAISTINLLSGPDTQIKTLQSNFTNELTKIAAGNSLSVGSLSGNEFLNTETRLKLHDFGLSGTGSGLTNALLSGPDIIAGTSSLRTTSSCDTTSEYYFYGSMTEEQLHLYLDRSIDMCNVSYWMQPDAILAYSQASAANLVPPTISDHTAEINMIMELGAKFIAGMVSFWPPWDVDTLIDPQMTLGLNQFKADVNLIHSHDCNVICEGRVWEAVGSEIDFTIEISNWIYIDFGLTPPSSTTYFVSSNIVYSNISDACGGYLAIDITKTEAQMWYYYRATRMIDNGAESIHFGDVFNINCLDTGNAGLWNVVNLVRKYAAGTNLSNTTGLPNARRGLVLCNAHTNLYPFSTFTKNSIYYDPPGEPIQPDWNRQLIFDFQSWGLQGVVKPDLITSCTADFQPLLLDPSSNYWSECTSGGRHPLGYYCAHNACTLNNDNGAAYSEAGCNWYIDSPYNFWNHMWGYDPASWFLAQSSYWKDKIIPYFYYGVKCINPYMHYYMPGKLFSSQVVGGVVSTAFFTANDFGKDTIINATWNGLPPVPATPYWWVFHDFTHENVSNWYLDPPIAFPQKSLIFVGPYKDKAYFIAPDGYIHGYIKVNGNYNDGTWLTVSPTYACGISSDFQVKAKSDLVANPEGTRLLYIGVDGFIYGFDILSVWTYTYITYQSGAIDIGFVHLVAGGFMRDQLFAQNIRAVSNLIYSDNGVFYIGKWLGDGTTHIHGFVFASGIWQTVSPSYSASIVYGPSDPSQLINNQVQSLGALTYDSDRFPNRIYYSGIDGFLYYFTVIDIWTYRYFDFAGNWLLNSSPLIKIIGNIAINSNRIYFVGSHYIPYVTATYLFCLIDNGVDAWTITNLCYSALDWYGQPLSAQQPSDPSGTIAVSPDGSIIAYIGSSSLPFVFFYQKYPDGSFYYNNTELDIYHCAAGNSLQFQGNSDMYFLGPSFGQSVRHYKFQQAFCLNPAVSEFP